MSEKSENYEEPNEIEFRPSSKDIKFEGGKEIIRITRHLRRSLLGAASHVATGTVIQQSSNRMHISMLVGTAKNVKN